MFVVCDTFDHEDYPVKIMRGEDPLKKYSELNGKNMQRVIEVYNMSMDIEAQIREARAFHLEEHKLDKAIRIMCTDKVKV